jgi:hypothetical protein
MAVVHGLQLAGALLALLCLPCVVAVLIFADEVLERLLVGLARRRASWRERRILVRLERRLSPTPSPAPPPAAEDGPRPPTIEQIAAALRRLDAQRLSVGTRTAVWHEAVLRAYDEHLRMACRCLRVEEHLTEVVGVDREIERLRVEGELQAAGLALRSLAGPR